MSSSAKPFTIWCGNSALAHDSLAIGATSLRRNSRVFSTIAFSSSVSRPWKS
jgi:hypothetical protein